MKTHLQVAPYYGYAFALLWHELHLASKALLAAYLASHKTDPNPFAGYIEYLINIKKKHQVFFVPGVGRMLPDDIDIEAKVQISLCT